MNLRSVFDWAMNRQKIGQSFTGNWAGPISVDSGMIVDLNLTGVGALNVLTRVEDLMSCVDVGGTCYVKRTFSLGDVLLLVPVVRHMNSLGYKMRIQTEDSYAHLLRLLGCEVQVVPARQPKDFGLLLDYIVERDHEEPTLQKQHRTNIYATAVGINDRPDVWDWSCDLANFPEVETPEKYIVFQGQGATKYRGISQEAIEHIITKLSNNGVKVVYVGEEIKLTVPSDVILLYHKASLPELFTWIGKAKAVVSMDSSPLWISHFTCTPVIAVLGPSRPEERITLHPLYPEGAIAIRTNEWIKCTSCFEKAEACEYEFRCVQKADNDQLYQEIIDKVVGFLEV